MDVLVERCAGLDVHRDSVMATVRLPGKRRRQREQHKRAFGTTIAQLQELEEWLQGFGVTLVGMEATGVYWQPVFDVLERRFECWLLNAQHLHNVPGRKTDTIDSAWICQLVEHGLVRPSLVPPPEIRRLRDLTRLRKAQINERARAIQRLEKVLQGVGIKLTSVASAAYSVSARAMLEAVRAGTTDTNELAELARGSLRGKTVHHFASWARICPGNNQSAGKHRSGKTLRGSRWLRQALTESARAAARTKGTYLASHYWQIRGRRGEPKAIGAIRHDILVAYYHIARDRVPFRELGADWLARRYSPEHRARRLVRQLEALGLKVTLEAERLELAHESA